MRAVSTTRDVFVLPRTQTRRGGTSTARLKSGAIQPSKWYPFPAPRPAAATLWRGLFCVVSRRRVGRGPASAGRSRVFALPGPESLSFAVSPTRPIAATAFSPHPAPVYGGRSRTYCYRRRESMDQEELLRPQEISSRSHRLVPDADNRVRPVKRLTRRHD